MRLYLSLINNGLHLLGKLFREIIKFGVRERIAWVLSPTDIYIYHYERDNATLRGPYWFLFRIPLENICDMGCTEVSSIHENKIQLLMAKENVTFFTEKLLKIDFFSQAVLDFHEVNSQQYLRLDCILEENHAQFTTVVPIELVEVENFPIINVILRITFISAMLSNFLENVSQEKSELTILLKSSEGKILIEVNEATSRRKLVFPAKPIDDGIVMHSEFLSPSFEIKLDKSLVKRLGLVFDLGMTNVLGVTEEGYFICEITPVGSEPTTQSAQVFTFGFLNSFYAQISENN